jgi:hypothetical protein
VSTWSASSTGSLREIVDTAALSVTFTPMDVADYNAVTTMTTINVLPAPQKATPIVTWSDPAGITYGTALGAAQLDAAASVPGTFAYTPAAGTVLNVGVNQTLAVTFTTTDVTDYTVVTAYTHINVDQPNPTPPHVTEIVGITRSKKGLRAITVGFDEALVRGSAVDLSLYSVLGAVTTHRKTLYTKRVRIKGISFDGTSRVTINLATPYKGVVKVTVHGGILATTGASTSGDFSAIVHS